MFFISEVEKKTYHQIIVGYGAEAGLPDISRQNIPKRGKIYHISTTLPNFPKIYQMSVNYFKLA
jgi:hypothetical protein